MVLILKLDYSASELCQVLIDEISELVTCKDSLILKNAHISPSLDETGIDIPQCGIAKKICVIVKESCRTYNLSITCSLDIDKLRRFGAHQNDKTVRLFPILGISGQTYDKNQYDAKESPHQRISLFTEFLLPTFTLEYAVLEERVDNDIGRLDLRIDEVVYRLH